jgi:hypothetical protein
VPQLYGTGGFEAQAQNPSAAAMKRAIGKYLLNPATHPAVVSWPEGVSKSLQILTPGQETGVWTGL